MKGTRLVKRVLYVEDEPALCEIFKRVLEPRGYAVDIALNGADGKAMHAADPYDIVALDYQLPDMTGLDIAREFLGQDENLPIVIITGRGNESIAAEALEIGVSNYIVKDSENSYVDLLPAVISHLEKRLEMISAMTAAEESLRESSEQLQAELVTQIDTTKRYEQQAADLASWAEGLATAKEKLDAYANNDELTGLPNRRLCVDRIETALGMSRRNKTQLAVMSVALRSATADDEILKEAAGRLRGLVREMDTVGRVGDDDFLLVLTNVENQAAADVVAEKAAKTLSESFLTASETVSVGARIGIALYPDDGSTAEGLIRVANSGMTG